MDRRGMSSENEPNFPGSSGSKKEKNGRTYRQKPKGWLAQSNKRSAKKDRQTVEEEALPMWKKPLSVKRCTLQTLGGSSSSNRMSPAPLKGDAAYNMNSTKATLRKMKPYGGKMFYDKCYLSSDDEREAEGEDKVSWELSPTDGTKARDAPAATIQRKKKNALPSSSIQQSGKKRKAAGAGGLDPFSMSGEESDGRSSESELDFEDDDEDLGKPKSGSARPQTAMQSASSSASVGKSSSSSLKGGLKA